MIGKLMVHKLLQSIDNVDLSPEEEDSVSFVNPVIKLGQSTAAVKK
ncbi:MAG: hypothetical protein V8Q27_09555 [Eubacteriales bacterium]